MTHIYPYMSLYPSTINLFISPYEPFIHSTAMQQLMVALWVHFKQAACSLMTHHFFDRLELEEETSPHFFHRCISQIVCCDGCLRENFSPRVPLFHLRLLFLCNFSHFFSTRRASTVGTHSNSVLMLPSNIK